MAQQESKEILCRYIPVTECIYQNAKWKGMSKLVQQKDRYGRPEGAFCHKICLAHIMPLHQTTSMFELGIQLSQQLERLIAEINSFKAPNMIIPEEEYGPEKNIRQPRKKSILR